MAQTWASAIARGEEEALAREQNLADHFAFELSRLAEVARENPWVISYDPSAIASAAGQLVAALRAARRQRA